MNYTDSDIQAIVDTQVELKTKELQERIDKAIEYIETTIIITAAGRKTTIDDVGYGRKLLSILKGEADED